MSLLKRLLGRDNKKTDQVIPQQNSATTTLLADLLDQFAGIYFEREMTFRQIIDEDTRNIDLGKATISFGPDQVFQVQLLGTFSKSSKTWLWAWANGASQYPENVLHHAKALREYGQENNLTLFTTPQFEFDENELYALGKVFAGLVAASSDYVIDSGDDLLLVTVQSAEVEQMVKDNDERIILMFAELIHRIAINQKPAFINYLSFKGFTVSADGTKLVAEKAGTEIVAEFNAQSQLTSLNASYPD